MVVQHYKLMWVVQEEYKVLVDLVVMEEMEQMMDRMEVQVQVD